MEKLVLPEAGFADTLKTVVEPYLNARKTECPLPRGAGKTLYCAHYRADAPVGVVVMSHGYTETEEKYREPIYYFLQKGFHVYMPDHCGHGRSYRLADDPCLVHVDRWQRYVEDLLAVAQMAQARYPDLPLYLYGHSMGGGIAAAALAQQPALFQKAVLSSPMLRPKTGGLPWWAARAAAFVLCAVGRARTYVPGHHPYDGAETFADSAATSPARFAFYNEKRRAEPLYQMSGASCGWMREAGRLSAYLLGRGAKAIRTPILLFQAENDTFVDPDAQTRFADAVNAAGHTAVTVERVPGTKHEIFNADTASVAAYWQRIFAFLQEPEQKG